MKDRLARAIWQFLRDLSTKHGSFDDPEADSQGRQNCLDSVDLMLNTIREPTQEMLQAGANEANTFDIARNVWTAMVDEALK